MEGNGEEEDERREQEALDAVSNARESGQGSADTSPR